MSLKGREYKESRLLLWRHTHMVGVGEEGGKNVKEWEGIKGIF